MSEALQPDFKSTKKYAFVVPRYGSDIGGGAETLVRELACRLAARGDSIQVWTTCARDNRTWANELPVGESVEQGVRVFRFPVDERNLETWIPLQIRIHEGMQLSLTEQLDWMQESVNSTGLYAHIISNSDSVDAIFFAPYLFGTTFWGSLLCPEKSVLIPCLHNESYAYTTVIQSMFRQVRGCLFNATPEQDLAGALYGTGKGGEVGMGFEFPSIAERDGAVPYFADSQPYILYLGRKETGKNVQLLLDYFISGKESGIFPAALRLVIAGGGSFTDLERPGAADRDDIVDIDYVSEEAKRSLLRHALFLCQPSTNESFSIVLMESWMLETPVVVHGSCAVTRAHVVESGGGLYFTDANEFHGVVATLLEQPELRTRMSAAGAAYVRDRYSWSAVLGRFDSVMEQLEES